MEINGSGPIPGENFTSDTKNYPWHRPPEFTDINKALDMLAKKITKFEVANGILVFVELGIPLTNITSMIIMAGIGEGKWTPDFGLLLAGPLCKMIETLAIGFDLEYTVGIETEDDMFTGEFFKEKEKLKNFSTEDAFKIVSEELPDIKAEASSQETPTDENGGTEENTPQLESQGFMSMMSGG